MPPPGALASDLVEVRGELLGMDSAYVGLTQVLDRGRRLHRARQLPWHSTSQAESGSLLKANVGASLSAAPCHAAEEGEAELSCMEPNRGAEFAEADSRG